MSKETLEKVGSTKVEPVNKEFNLEYFNLKKSSSSAEIEAALPEKHLFELSEVYSVIGGLMSKQANGEEGPLLNSGDWNIFYTEKFCVSVHWHADYGLWRVYTWPRDGGWRGDDRVFSPGLEN